MDREAHLRSLLDFPAIVVGYFTGPQTAQAALAELLTLGLPAGDASLIDAKAGAAEPEAPAALGWFQRLTGMGRKATEVPVTASALPATGAIIVVQAIHLPVETIADVCRRHGATKVDTRGSVHTATQGQDGEPVTG